MHVASHMLRRVVQRRWNVLAKWREISASMRSSITERSIQGGRKITSRWNKSVTVLLYIFFNFLFFLQIFKTQWKNRAWTRIYFESNKISFLLYLANATTKMVKRREMSPRWKVENGRIPNDHNDGDDRSVLNISPGDFHPVIYFPVIPLSREEVYCGDTG